MGKCQKINAKRRPVVIHKRVGLGADDFVKVSSDEVKCFSPKVLSSTNTSAVYARHWIITAMTSVCSNSNRDELIKIVAIPCSNIREGVSGKLPYCLTANVALPPGCTVIDMSFYGDDGSSSLTSSADIDLGGGEEGRQALGILVEQDMGNVEDSIEGFSLRVISEQLWLFQYDGLPYHWVESSHKSAGKISISREKADCCISSCGGDTFVIMTEEHEDAFSSILVKRKCPSFVHRIFHCCSHDQLLNTNLTFSFSPSILNDFFRKNN